MDSNTSDSNMSNPTSAPLSALARITWIVLLATESLLIVIFNLLTIIVFATQRQRNRRRAYIPAHTEPGDCRPLGSGNYRSAANWVERGRFL